MNRSPMTKTKRAVMMNGGARDGGSFTGPFQSGSKQRQAVENIAGKPRQALSPTCSPNAVSAIRVGRLPDLRVSPCSLALVIGSKDRARRLLRCPFRHHRTTQVVVYAVRSIMKSPAEVAVTAGRLGGCLPR